MSYEKFVQEVERELKSRAGKERRVYLNKAVKNNGQERTGVTFVDRNINISPTIYLEEYYERYENGTDLHEIAEQILSLYQEVKFEHSWEGDYVQKYSNIKDKIIYRLISRKKNAALLEQIPFLPYLDLAVIFLVLVDMNEDCSRMATMLIRKEHLGWWGITRDQLYLDAHMNTEKLLPYEFVTMYAVIQELLGGEEQGPEEEDMYILTNVLRNFGAAAMLYQDRLEGIAACLKENYYILPSSVHEVIVVPESHAPGRGELDLMIGEVNSTQVDAEEVLSERSYYYDRQKRELIL